MDETRLKILRLILREIGGYKSGRQAAKTIGVTPARVSQILNEYAKEGYLVKVASPGEMTIWKPGPNLTEGVLSRLRVASDPGTVGTVGPPSFFEETVPEDLPIAVEEGFTPVRVHNIRHRLPVTKAPENVPWTRETTPSGVPNKVLAIPLSLDPKDARVAKIVYRETAKGEPSSLEICTPEVIIVHPEAWLRFREWAASRAWNISIWFTKKYGAQYSKGGSMVIPEECGQFEVAVVIPRDLAMAGKRLRLTDGIYYFDISKGVGEMEVKGSTDQETDEATWDLITAARRVRILEGNVQSLMERVVVATNANTAAVEKIIKVQMAHADTITTLVDVLSPKEPEPPRGPKPLSDYDQVMFG